jgi:hypothetical protein
MFATGREKSTSKAAVASHEDGTSWETPIPFDSHEGLPTFPLESLPSWLASYVLALSTSTQTPPDLPAMLSLATIATATAKTARVRLREDHSEPLNLFVAVALPPGSRKSAVFGAVTAPLSSYEREGLEVQAPLRDKATATLKLAERKLESAITKAANATAEQAVALEAEVRRLAEEKSGIRVPNEPRLIAEDCTPEKLGSLLAEQGGRMAVLSAEGGGVFEMMAGRYSETSNLEVYLKGHAGDDLRVDRVKRAAESVRAPALTLGLAIQPSVLRAFTESRGFRDRGLLGRFLYSLPPNTIGSRKADPPPMPSHTRDTYERCVRALLARKLADEPFSEAAILPAPGARAALIRFSEELEPRLGAGGDLGHVGDWAGKLSGAVGRIAGLLHLATLADSAESAAIPEIPLATMDKAIRIGRYLIEHALAAFDLMGADPVIEHAKTVLAWILRTRRDSFTVRDVHQALKSRFPRVHELAEPLKVLAERGHVREVETSSPGGPGRPPSPVYEVNPCLSQSSESSQRVGRAGSEDSEISERGEA